MKSPTYVYEGAVVACALMATVFIAGGGWREWVGAVAVQLTFHHAAIADRMAERQARQAVPDVPCHPWSARFFVAKETLWFVYFAAVGAWPALVGVVLFLMYPAWRRYWRSVHPLGAA